MAKSKDQTDILKQEFAFKVSENDNKLSLKNYDAKYTAGLSKNDGTKYFENIDSGLNEIQELLYAAQKNSVLIILQGMDTSGKDGTISHVMGNVNPQGCVVSSFKAPTQEEASHDFLWRVHQRTPAKGIMGIFNRSHYEDVLVARVHNIVPEEVWKKRYAQINAFEELLSDNGTIIMKFFLYISKDEQDERLKAREDDKDKLWKLSSADFLERQYWNDYIKAFEEALTKCSTKNAPWYIVPANHKWFRNLAVAKVIVDTLKPYMDSWRKELEERGQKEYETIKKMNLGELSVNQVSKTEK